MVLAERTMSLGVLVVLGLMVNQLPEVEARASAKGGRRCVEGSTWKDDCNTCFCSNGFPTCTKVVCPSLDIGLYDRKYTAFNDRQRSWQEATDKCSSQGLRMAEPSEDDVVQLRKYILGKYGEGVWLNAHGDDSHIKWLGSGREIRDSNSLWEPGHPGGVDSIYCLMLLAWDRNWRKYPDQPFASWDCNSNAITLCEAQPGASGNTDGASVRQDGKCGPEHRAPNGGYVQCNQNNGNCCTVWGYCGGSECKPEWNY